jgi:hypothetical protein
MGIIQTLRKPFGKKDFLGMVQEILQH